jgi:hypothetical protein
MDCVMDYGGLPQSRKERKGLIIHSEPANFKRKFKILASCVLTVK